MAIYDGFFDAVYDEATSEYDRTYDSGDFTNYFGELIGSGVCIYNNPDSMKVNFADGAAVVAPGYLFIQGYWLKNDSDYAVPLSGAGAYAIAAHLSLAGRRIDIEAREKADSYPEDTLVLAYVTVDSTGAAVVEDTRADRTVCGIIDSMGEMSQKVAWAIEYIDNEINAKLEQAEADIKAQSELLDAKISAVEAEVNKLQPPPIGTIKFSASQNVEEGWLHCDGSFVSEADYPELVAALGKLTPGVEDFKEVTGGAYSGMFSTSCLYKGWFWVFSLSANKLLGFSVADGTKKEITVTGTENLVTSTVNLINLSISEGHVFLVQNQGSVQAFILLEATEFTGDNETLAFSRLDITGLVTKIGENFVPEVVSGVYNFGSLSTPDNAQAFFMALGAGSEYIPSNYYKIMSCLVWKVGDFSTAKFLPSYTDISFGHSSNGYSVLEHGAPYVRTLHRFSRKMSNEMFFLRYAAITGSADNYSANSILPQSKPLGLFSTSSDKFEVNGAGYPYPDEGALVSPVAGNNLYINRVVLSNKTLSVRAGKISPNEPYSATPSDGDLPILLPSGARLFQDSLCFCQSQLLWVVFVGTGFAFSKDPLNVNKWGYLDTSKTLGNITQFGNAEYDNDTQTLCISGRDTTSRLRVGLLRFQDVFDYANDGAFLPNIASDGVPAYIKAKETDKPDVPDVIVDPVSVTITVQSAGTFDFNAYVVFNGESLIAGTYTRTLSESGTFSAGFRMKQDGGGSGIIMVELNGTVIAIESLSNAYAGDEVTASFKVSDFATNGITLLGKA